MNSTTNTICTSPPVPVFYADFDSPLSTKKERVIAIILTYQFLLQSKSYNERCGLTYFEQCFEQERKIGEGSFGEVFRVKSKEDNKWYAVKRTIEPFRNASDRELKLREVQKHELLPKHPNLVEFIRAWEEKGRLFIQTELCEYSLSDYAEREHNIPEEQLWFYFADLVSAVNHLHSHNLLHLDIKPENIFVSRDQVCKLGDFGLIFDLNKDTLITAREGDSKYLAPEVLNSPPDKPADIFSLGISILELATDLDLPSRGEGWRMLREGNIPESFTDKLSPKLRHLIYWMMDPDSCKRPTAEQLLNDVTIQYYLSLRRKQRSTQFSHHLLDVLVVVYVYLVCVIQFILRPITKSLSWATGTPSTPLAEESPRRAVFYNGSTPESPSRHVMPHSTNVVQRLRFDSCDSDEDNIENNEQQHRRHHFVNKHRHYKNSPEESVSESNGCYSIDSSKNASSTTTSSKLTSLSPVSARRPDRHLSNALHKDKLELSESPRKGKSPQRRILVDDQLNNLINNKEIGVDESDDEDERNESRSRRFHLKRNLRAAMSAPVPRRMRAQMRSLAIKPIPKLDFSLIETPTKVNNVNDRLKTTELCTAQTKIPFSLRQVSSFVVFH
ncbi:unnamed protein product [Anisakis simplex]|uniref:Membrane-associated tyrosine- and threonine-specific cdc2-inhibitory kinase wee-1.3 n=1 Tax=Anisakis simplex TaxID=6269 RepID=A0A0M3K0F0_ANISI|nr:unnamed protein product [Anisakis simplex]